MDILLASTAALVLLGLKASPSPYWPTYFRLWSIVLRETGTWTSKYKQVSFLLKAAILAPLWGLLWLIDDIFYPAYKSRTIKPIFIIGQPRCGTTLLHRTLAADSETFFAVKHIEWRYPFIAVQKFICFFKVDQWLEKINYWPDSEAGKLAAKMHPNHLSDWEEDGIFFEENHLHHFFIFLRFPHPNILEYLDSFQELSPKAQSNMLESHHKVLQKVQYLRGTEQRIYLSKEVTSHNKIPYILERYENVKFILTVRFAEEFMSSLIALMRMSTSSKTGVDPINIDGWENAVIRRMQVDSRLLIKICRDTIKQDSLVHLSANHYMRDIDIATEEVYKSLGLPMNDSFRLFLKNTSSKQKKRARGYTYERLTLEGFELYDEFVEEVIEKFQNRMANNFQG